MEEHLAHNLDGLCLDTLRLWCLAYSHVRANGHHSHWVLRSFEVREICLLELVSPRMQASQQTLQIVLIQSGSAIISRRAKVRDSLLGHKRLIGVSPPTETEKQKKG